MTYSNLLVEQRASTCIITINRPKQLNALNKETIAELHAALAHADQENSIRCIVLTGAEDKAFVAGADIKEFANFSVEEGKRLSAEGHQELFDFVEQLNTPVIAAVNGYALGGGLELAMACHIRIASENAQMGLPEVSLGVIPGYGGTQRLTQLIGKGRAMQLIFTAGMMGAADAEAAGLVNAVVAQEELMGHCEKLAGKIARNSPSAIASAIRAVNAAQTSGVNGYEVEIEEFGKCFGTADFKEGTTAFLEKRKPVFTGE